MRNNWSTQLVASVAIMLICATAFLVVIKLLGFENLTINDMMVSFIGILATFVVISNVAQVQEIKHESISAMEKIQHNKEDLSKTIQILLEKTPEYVAAKALLEEIEKPYDNRNEWILSGIKSKDENRLDEVIVYVDDISEDGTISFLDKNKRPYQSTFYMDYYLSIRDIWESANYKIQEPSYKFILCRMLEYKKKKKEII